MGLERSWNSTKFLVHEKQCVLHGVLGMKTHLWKGKGKE